MLIDVAGRLALFSALECARQAGRPSDWSLDEWLALTRPLSSRERIVVAMHAIRGLGFERIAEWFEISRQRVDQIWRGALKKMREDQVPRVAVA